MDDKALKIPGGLSSVAAAFLLGVVLLQQPASLPSPVSLLAGLPILLSLLGLRAVLRSRQSFLGRYITLIIVFILLINIGFVYAFVVASAHLAHRLDESAAGRDLLISGVIAGIPKQGAHVQRFDFVPLGNGAGSDAGGLRRIRLSWYYGRTVRAGETWQLTVRLKPPHGFRNPGGFDYEGWLFQQGIDATGYVRKAAGNRRLQPAPWWSIDRWRQYYDEQIGQLSSADGASNGADSLVAVIRALAIGERSAMSNAQWQVFSATGTSHLMAISGLHIALAFLFGYLLCRYLLPARWMLRMPAQHLATLAGLVLALLYALLAGMTVPTQRALIMLLVLAGMRLLRREHRPQDALGLALLLVLLFDPMAVLSAGFWFSFSAVAVIFIALHTGTQTPADRGAGEGGAANGTAAEAPVLAAMRRGAARLWQWMRLQLLISLGLLPLSLFMFQQVSLVSPLANLLMIPYLSVLVVPLVLLAMLLQWPAPALAQALFELAHRLLQLVWPWLSRLADLPFAVWQRGDIGVLDVLLSSAGLLLLVLSAGRASGQRRVCLAIGLILLLPLMRPLWSSGGQPPATGDFRLYVLDVGQGTAVVIETTSHVLLYDSGARFSPRFDAGSAVILPFLRARGMRPDRLVISHGDADHIGGADAVLAAYPDIDLYGQDLETLDAVNKQACYRGMHWRWDGVDFAFLSPARDTPAGRRRNNRSCVLRVWSAAGSVLLSGDIEKKTEKQLLALKLPLRADVLLVPHHGSNTSSSSAFIRAVSPAVAIIPVAYRNRYRLPAARVLARYARHGVRVIQTWRSGRVRVDFSRGGEPVVRLYRRQAKKYWHRRLP